MNPRAVHGFKLKIERQQRVWVPVGADVLSVQNYNGVTTLYVEGDATRGVAPRTIVCYGTGHEITHQGRGRTFIGTTQDQQGAVWHWFEVKEEKDPR